MKPTYIKVGDKFIKPNDTNTVWVVKRPVNQLGIPPHAELHDQKYLNRMMTMSLYALADQNLFQQNKED
jgi:hypothetical protein